MHYPFSVPIGKKQHGAMHSQETGGKDEGDAHLPLGGDLQEPHPVKR